MDSAQEIGFLLTLCSQMVTTCQPIFLNSRHLFLSRLLLASSLETQKSLLDLGTLPWAGQECQKHP